MPRTRRTIKPKTEAAREIRHEYRPGDQIKDDKWKDLYKVTEPITVSLDVGTFQWLWDFVDRKGIKADSENFQVYSDVLKDTYRRAANQFAVAAQEAFGDTYKVDPSEPAEEVPAEASESTPKRRRKRKAPESTAKNFSASQSLTEPSKDNPARTPRSERRKRRKTGK